MAGGNALYSQNDFAVSDSNVFCKDYGITFYFIRNDTDSIVSYTWDFGDSASVTVTDTFIIHSYSDTGIYSVSLVTTDTGGVTDTIVHDSLIVIRDTSLCDFVIDSTNLPSYDYFFVATDTNGIFDWEINGNTFEDTTYRSYYSFHSQGEYSVVLNQTVAYNCTAHISKKVEVSDELYAPNVFTPNGDGVNDYFEPKVNGVDDYTLTIFNRYGEIVYEITSKRPLWDGRTPSGVEMVNGLYYFVLENNKDNNKKLSGFVYLFR